MGSSQSVEQALKALLEKRNLKLGRKTLRSFVKEIDRVAPWFACSGSLTRPSWKKLGKDLAGRKDLRMGTMAIWKMVNNCLKDESCEEVRQEGQMALETVQDSMSETERSERMGARARVSKNVRTKKDKEKPPVRPLEAEKGGDSGVPVSPQKTTDSWWEPIDESVPKVSLYPVKELEALDIQSSEESSEEDDRLNTEDEAELESEAGRYEEERYHPDERMINLKVPRPNILPGRPPRVAPTAPPAYVARPTAMSLIPERVHRKLQLAYPVFVGDGERVYAPVDFNQIKELAESVRKYGINGNFTLMQLERLATNAMTPSDWQTVIKAVLPSTGQYMEWKALWHEAALQQAKTNAAALTPEQREWTFDMLIGQGRHMADQANFPMPVYAQVSQAAIRAWKSLSKKGEANNQLTKIVQGPQEPFSDYVARMMEVAGKIFGDPDYAGPFIEQLIFEQATQECRNAIAPRKNKGLQEWLRICREIGTPLTNSGLAAAILKAQNKAAPARRSTRTCFNCGKPGHLAKECRAPKKGQEARPLCSRCQKGYHPVNQCRSVRDIKGNLLPPPGTYNRHESKNGQTGPQPRGPQKYGTQFVKAEPLTEEPCQEEAQEWTCTPPPRSY